MTIAKAPATAVPRINTITTTTTMTGAAYGIVILLPQATSFGVPELAEEYRVGEDSDGGHDGRDDCRSNSPPRPSASVIQNDQVYAKKLRNTFEKQR